MTQVRRTPRIGDVLCTRTPKGWPARLIRLGAALRDRPNTVNHVIVVHHWDAAGTLWGIEGRPGGVGYVDIAGVVESPWTVSNIDQPKEEHQRGTIALVAESMLGTPYDWTGIALDAMEAIGADHLWREKWDHTPPAHVVCSSLADWVYEHVGLASPKPDRTCTPAHWAHFITTQGWDRL